MKNNCTEHEYTTCHDFLNCCDCGFREDGCGCAYCWNCNACENCYSERED